MQFVCNANTSLMTFAKKINWHSLQMLLFQRQTQISPPESIFSFSKDKFGILITFTTSCRTQVCLSFVLHAYLVYCLYMCFDVTMDVYEFNLYSWWKCYKSDDGIPVRAYVYFFAKSLLQANQQIARSVQDLLKRSDDTCK